MARTDKLITPEKPFLLLELDTVEGHRKVEAVDFSLFIFMNITPEITDIFGYTPK